MASSPVTQQQRTGQEWRLSAAAWALVLALRIAVPGVGAADVPSAARAQGTPGSVSVVDQGAIPNDGLDDTAAVTAAIAACGRSDSKTLFFPGGTFNLAALTFPAGIQVILADGALLEVGADATLTFDGPFTAGLYRVFSDSGRIQFGNAAVTEVYPQWWGSAGAADASPAINRAIAAAPSLPGIRVRLSGAFECQTPIRVDRDRVTLSGDGMYATRLTFNPAVPSPLIEFAKPDRRMVVQCAIRDMALFGAGSVQKVGIRIVDADIIEVRDLAIQQWWGGGSIGLQVQGREMGFIENISVVADLPISIEKDPNIDWISIDHFTFRNTYLITKDANGPAVRLASGIYLSNVVFEGTNAWCGGKYGLYWDDTETKGVSLNLSVRNVRMEQGAAAGGEIIHIAHGYTLHNLILENLYGCSGGVGGIYLRRCVNATLQNIFYTSVDRPTPTALDIDESSSNIVLINAFWNAGEIKTGNLLKTFGTHSNPSKAGNRVIEVYDRPGNPQGEGLVLYGTNAWCHSGELAAGASIPLPVGAGMPGKVATVTVAASDGAACNECGSFMVGANGTTVLVAGTAAVATTPTPGKLCLVPGNRVQVLNQLGAKVDVVITLFWK
jgi:hypothetical protein